MNNVKAISLNKNVKTKVIYLLSAPLLIGLVYLFFSPAKAWGPETDTHKRNPSQQGWSQVRVFEVRQEEYLNADPVETSSTVLLNSPSSQIPTSSSP